MGVVLLPTVKLLPLYSWKGAPLSLWCSDRPVDFDYSWLFLILSILGLRQWLVRIMPQSLVLAVGAGIGLFIA
jgi:hypothetical protein